MPVVLLVSYQIDVRLLYIGQRVLTHLSLGQKRRRLPSPIQVVACAHLRLGLNVIHCGP
jgi:hypothetical protein